MHRNPRGHQRELLLRRPARMMSFHWLRQYDDITPSAIPVFAFVNTTTGGLFHQAFTVTSTPNAISGVKAHSPNNIAITGSVTQMLNGNAMITTNYPGSTTKSFDANSVYYGCFLSGNAGANTAAVGYWDLPAALSRTCALMPIVLKPLGQILEGHCWLLPLLNSLLRLAVSLWQVTRVSELLPAPQDVLISFWLAQYTSWLWSFDRVRQQRLQCQTSLQLYCQLQSINQPWSSATELLSAIPKHVQSIELFVHLLWNPATDSQCCAGALVAGYWWFLMSIFINARPDFGIEVMIWDTVI